MFKRLLVVVFLICAASTSSFADDLVGKWVAAVNGKEFVLDIKSVGEKPTGTMTFPDAEGPSDIANSKLDGSKLSFDVTVKHEGQEFKVGFSGSVSDSEITLTITAGAKGGAPPLKFTKTR